MDDIMSNFSLYLFLIAILITTLRVLLVEKLNINTIFKVARTQLLNVFCEKMFTNEIEVFSNNLMKFSKTNFFFFSLFLL